MKTKRTPGPWEVKVHDKGPYFTEVEVWHENYGLIARMPDNTSIWNSEKKEDVALEILATTKANAKIMATAPEMLERLEYVVSWLENTKVHADIVRYCKETIKKAKS